MRNRMLTTAWLLAAILPNVSMAQDVHREGSWEWNLSAGALRVDPFLRDFLTSGSPETRFGDPANLRRIRLAVEGRVGYNFTPNLGLSLSVTDAIGNGVSILNLGESFTYTFDLNDRTSPFVIVGADLTRINGGNGRVTHSTWGAHAGLGVRRMLTDELALRAEARVQVAGYNEVPMRISTTYAPIALLGLSYFVGGHAPNVVMAPARACPACAAPLPARVDTVRLSSRPARVDTLRLVRVDTIRLAQPPVMNDDQVILRVQFKTNRTELLPISYSVLNTVAAAIKATPNSTWKVEGHTDSVGTNAANMILSKGRAQTVADYLVSRGIRREILSAEGYGRARPVFSNATAEGRAQNRRVQLRRIPLPPTVKVP